MSNKEALKEFTPEQEKLFESVVEQWAQIGMGTEPCNFELAKEGIIEAYKEVGADVPMWWLRASSPVEAAKGIYIGKRQYEQICKDFGWDNEFFYKNSGPRREAAKKPLYDCKEPWAAEVYASLEENIKPNVPLVDENGEVYSRHEDLPARLIEGFLHQAMGILVDRFGQDALRQAQIMREKYTAFGNEIYAKTEWKSNDVRAELSTYLSEQRYGCQDTIWLSLCTFFRDHCELIKETEPLLPLKKIAEAAGWWCAYKGFACAQDRFVCFKLDDEKQVHCDDGPAIAYRDGVKIWVLHGTLVDEQIVMHPETQTIEQINAETNGDIQAIRIERFGWARYAKEVNAEVLDKEMNPVSNTPEILCRFPDRGVRLLAGCVTGRMVSMGVDANCKTCKEAREWLRPQGRGKLNEIAAT